MGSLWDTFKYARSRVPRAGDPEARRAARRRRRSRHEESSAVGRPGAESPARSGGPAPRQQPSPEFAPDAACPSYPPAHASPTPVDDLDKPRDECGIFGVFNHPDAARLTYYGLHALQHRGQESAGIVTSVYDEARGERVMPSHKDFGLVLDVFSDKARFDETLVGDAAIGHTRYSTSGSATNPANVQPFVGALPGGKPGPRAQRQPVERAHGPRGAHGARHAVQLVVRLRAGPAPGGAEHRDGSRGAHHRRAVAVRGRVLARHADRRRARGRPRPERLPTSGAGPSAGGAGARGARLGGGVRDVRLRHRGRGVRARRGAGRGAGDRPRWPRARRGRRRRHRGVHRALPDAARARGAVRVRVRLLLPPRLQDLRRDRRQGAAQDGQAARARRAPSRSSGRAKASGRS